MEIKFEVLRFDTKEIVGWERIGDRGQWEHIRPKRDTWLLGAITDGQEYSKFIRRQFTGLTDKKRTEQYPNGQEIYEGDIIADENRDSEDNIYVCEYVVEEAAYYFISPLDGDILEENSYVTDLIIIGNIYESKELLENN